MKRLTLFLISVIVLAGCGSDAPEAPDVDTETPIMQSEPAMIVSVIQVSAEHFSSLALTGTVKSENEIIIQPQTAGTVVRIYVDEGTHVKAGDVIMELSGSNGLPHPSETQYQVAETNAITAQRGLELILAANEEALHAAQIQLRSAEAQSEASKLDVQALVSQSLNAMNAVGLAQYGLQTTQTKHDIDLLQRSLDIKDLEDMIRDQKRDERREIADLRDDLRTATDLTVKETIRSKIRELERELDEEEALEEQLEDAQLEYVSFEKTAGLTEAQLIAQLHQAETQAQTLGLSTESAALRAGLNEETANPIQSAQSQVQATLIRNESSLLQAQSQLELARLGLESAYSARAGLIVQSPIDGIIADVAVSIGDSVGPQSSLLTIINPELLKLVVPVDVDSAARIELPMDAVVELGGQSFDAPILSVAPMANTDTRLVNVEVKLPGYSARVNQSLEAEIPMVSRSKGDDSFFIPLDAIIVGTEDAYVFLYEDGIARQVEVDMGEIRGDEAEIIDGIQEGDQIIVDGAKDLIDGQAVTTE